MPTKERKLREHQKRIQTVILDVEVELHNAESLHSPAHSYHEAFAILKEEVDELWEEIKQKEPCNQRITSEATQVAAMALRFLVDQCNNRHARSKK
jgi:hypothetical protein